MKINFDVDIDMANRDKFLELFNPIPASIKREQSYDEAHLDKLLAQEPMWELSQHEEIVKQLFHIGNHYDIIKQHLPQTVEQLAMILAMIRPGKRYLVGNSWEVVENEVWEQTDGYFFKKSHAIGYALVIIVQLNLLVSKV